MHVTEWLVILVQHTPLELFPVFHFRVTTACLSWLQRSRACKSGCFHNYELNRSETPHWSLPYPPIPWWAVPSIPPYSSLPPSLSSSLHPSLPLFLSPSISVSIPPSLPARVQTGCSPRHGRGSSGTQPLLCSRSDWIQRLPGAAFQQPGPRR